MSTADSAGNAFPGLSTQYGFSNVRRLLPAFTNGVDGTWEGGIDVPDDYSSGGSILVRAVVNANSGAVRWIAGTAVVADSVTEDTAYTDETAQNVTVPGTAKQRFTTTFTLSTTPVAGSSLNVRIKRNGANGGDTCTAVALLWVVEFEYTA